jgi:hypothetical protein
VEQYDSKGKETNKSELPGQFPTGTNELNSDKAFGGDDIIQFKG